MAIPAPSAGRLLGGVLVGGASRRMGRPKALEAVGGLALAARAAAALAPWVEATVLLGAGPVPPALAGLDRLPDVPLAGGAGGGPLGALLAALRWAPHATWVVVPCDLPRVTPAAVAWLLGERRAGRVAVVPRPGPGAPFEPLFALYEPAAAPLLEALAAAGRRAPREIVGQPGVAVVAPPPGLAACWRDVDTPEELVAARGDGTGSGGEFPPPGRC